MADLQSLATPPARVKGPPGDSPPAPAGAGPLARTGGLEAPVLPALERDPSPFPAPSHEPRKLEERAAQRWAREKDLLTRTQKLVRSLRDPSLPHQRLTPDQAIRQRNATSPEAALVSGLSRPLETVYEYEELPARDIILIRGETKTACAPTFGMAVCASGHRKPVAFGCAKRRCTSKVCRQHALAERSHLVRPLIMDAFPEHRWGKVVLTYAPEVRELLRDRRLESAARAWAEAMVEGFFLDAARVPDGWRLGVVSVDHPCGDGDQREAEAHEGHVDAEEWYPHHNFLFPLVAFGPTGRGVLEKVDEVTGEHTPAKPDVSRRRSLPHWIDLDELRRRWRELQEVILGRPLGRDANFWFGYASTDEAKLALCSYFPRTFPQWPGKAQRLSYYGAFGCQVLHTLREAARLVDDVGEGLVCDECGAPYIRVVMDAGGDGPLTRSLPHGYRLLLNDSS